MLRTGTVPVLPSGPNGERTLSIHALSFERQRNGGDFACDADGVTVKGKNKAPAAPAEEEDEEAELRKLQAEMAM